MLACFASVIGAVAAVFAGPAATADGVEWAPIVEPDRSIFPSFVVATATMKWPEEAPAQADAASACVTLGDEHGMLGIGITSPAEGTKIRVRIEAPEVMEASVFSGVLGKKGVVHAVSPKIKWKYRELLRSRQQMPVNVTFTVRVGDGEEEEKFEVVTLRSVNDCLHTYQVGEEVRLVRWMFAAYVNEDHPWVDTLLKEALDTGVVTRFTGYQENDADVVLRQVYAVWNVLQRRGVRYSNIVTVSAGSTRVGSQHVRLLDEAVTATQANCVDGSVMFASVMRKIGLDVHLVLVPGHMFIAFKTDPASDEYVGLETTVIGQHTRVEFDKTKTLRSLMIDAPSFDDVSFATFEAALKVATERLAQDAAKFGDAAEEEYQLVSMEEARLMGVRPMPFLKDETPKQEGLSLEGLKIKK
jgi:hypothetical protein